MGKRNRPTSGQRAGNFRDLGFAVAAIPRVLARAIRPIVCRNIARARAGCSWSGGPQNFVPHKRANLRRAIARRRLPPRVHLDAALVFGHDWPADQEGIAGGQRMAAKLLNLRQWACRRDLFLLSAPYSVSIYDDSCHIHAYSCWRARIPRNCPHPVGAVLQSASSDHRLAARRPPSRRNRGRHRNPSRRQNHIMPALHAS